MLYISLSENLVFHREIYPVKRSGPVFSLEVIEFVKSYRVSMKSSRLNTELRNSMIEPSNFLTEEKLYVSHFHPRLGVIFHLYSSQSTSFPGVVPFELVKWEKPW